MNADSDMLPSPTALDSHCQENNYTGCTSDRTMNHPASAAAPSTHHFLVAQLPMRDPPPAFNTLQRILQERRTFTLSFSLKSFPASLWEDDQPPSESLRSPQLGSTVPLRSEKLSEQCVRPQACTAVNCCQMLLPRDDVFLCEFCDERYCSVQCRDTDWLQNAHSEQCSWQRLRSAVGDVIDRLSAEERKEIAFMATRSLAVYGRGCIVLAFASMAQVEAFLQHRSQVLLCPPFYCPMRQLKKLKTSSVRIPCSSYNTQSSFVLTVGVCVPSGKVQDQLYAQCVVLPLNY